MTHEGTCITSAEATTRACAHKAQQFQASLPVVDAGAHAAHAAVALELDLQVQVGRPGAVLEIAADAGCRPPGLLGRIACQHFSPAQLGNSIMPASQEERLAPAHHAALGSCRDELLLQVGVGGDGEGHVHEGAHSCRDGRAEQQAVCVSTRQGTSGRLAQSQRKRAACRIHGCSRRAVQLVSRRMCCAHLGPLGSCRSRCWQRWRRTAPWPSADDRKGAGRRE